MITNQQHATLQGSQSQLFLLTQPVYPPPQQHQRQYLQARQDVVTSLGPSGHPRPCPLPSSLLLYPSPCLSVLLLTGLAYAQNIHDTMFYDIAYRLANQQHEYSVV